jgi:hypothetical protein
MPTETFYTEQDWVSPSSLASAIELYGAGNDGNDGDVAGGGGGGSGAYAHYTNIALVSGRTYHIYCDQYQNGSIYDLTAFHYIAFAASAGNGSAASGDTPGSGGFGGGASGSYITGGTVNDPDTALDGNTGEDGFNTANSADGGGGASGVGPLGGGGGNRGQNANPANFPPDSSGGDGDVPGCGGGGGAGTGGAYSTTAFGRGASGQVSITYSLGGASRSLFMRQAVSCASTY